MGRAGAKMPDVPERDLRQLHASPLSGAPVRM